MQCSVTSSRRFYTIDEFTNTLSNIFIYMRIAGITTWRSDKHIHTKKKSRKTRKTRIESQYAIWYADRAKHNLKHWEWAYTIKPQSLTHIYRICLHIFNLTNISNQTHTNTYTYTHKKTHIIVDQKCYYIEKKPRVWSDLGQWWLHTWAKFTQGNISNESEYANNFVR